MPTISSWGSSTAARPNGSSENSEERLEKFGLALHPEKTRLIEFGRFAAENRRKRGEGKPETFTFLGFTHICGRKQLERGFIVKRETATKRLRAKLSEVKQALLRRRHEPIPEQGAWLRGVVRGYFNYHGSPATRRLWNRSARKRSDTGCRRFGDAASVTG